MAVKWRLVVCVLTSLWRISVMSQCPTACICTSQFNSGLQYRQTHHSSNRQRQVLARLYNHLNNNLPQVLPLTKMTCIGLADIPDNIATGTISLSLYGDAKRSSVGCVPQGGASCSQLTDLSKLVLYNLKELAVEGNRIQNIPADLFARMSNLELLSLSSNQLEMVLPNTFGGLEKLQRIDLSDNRLSLFVKLSEKPLYALEWLSLNHNNIEGLFYEHFTLVPALKHLDVSSNRIAYIDPLALQYVPMLQRLNLQDNRLERISQKWFSRSRELKWLSLASNRIKIIEGDTFHQLSNLQNLDLSGNEISSLDSAMLRGLSNLEELSLNSNGLAVIEQHAFTPCARLRELRLSGNILGYLNEKMFTGLSYLSVVDLSRNSIEDISDIGLSSTLNSTRKLDLSYNRVYRIRSMTFSNMLHLRELSLHHNQISYIDDRAFTVSTVTKVSPLGWLFLDCNRIRSIRSQTFAGTRYLKYLGLSYNLISYMSQDALEGMFNLINADLAYNRLQRLPAGMFRSLGNVVRLDLSSNQLTSLNNLAFDGLVNLVDLHLNNNFISLMPSDVYEQLYRVRQLSLANNRLSSLDLSLFTSMASLRHLNLSHNVIGQFTSHIRIPSALDSLDVQHNRLQTITADVLESLAEDGQIYLGYNPWSCSCQLSWLTFDDNRIKMAGKENVKCNLPHHLNNIQVTNISEHIMCAAASTSSPTSTSTRAVQTTNSVVTTSPPVLQTRPPRLRPLTQHLASADMPIGPLPPMPKLLCEQITARNTTERGKKMVEGWHVSLVERGKEEVVCTGVWLDDNWATVQASCAERAVRVKDRFKVVVGNLFQSYAQAKLWSRDVRKVIIHPEYSRKGGRKYNIALIQLVALEKSLNIYSYPPCILSQHDLKTSIKNFKVGMVTASPKRGKVWGRGNDITATNIKLAPKLCSSGKYVCSRFTNINSTSHNVVNAPIYTRYGIRQVDWGLAALTTSRWRKSKSGKTVVHKHVPLYTYINWFDHVMSKDEKYLVL